MSDESHSSMMLCLSWCLLSDVVPGLLLCESKNHEPFDLTLTFNCAMTNQIRDEKPQATKVITITACGFFCLASDWLFPRNTVTFQK